MDDSAITNNEALANYVFDSKKFRSDQKVHHRALMPSREGNRSVFRVTGLSNAQVAEIGTDEVAPGQGRPHIGWANLIAENVRNVGLHLKVDEPPFRHAIIENWPAALEQRRTLAMQLAADATIQRWPEE